MELKHHLHRQQQHTVAGVELPGPAELVEHDLELVLGIVPSGDLAEEVVRARGQLERELEAKDAVHVLQELEAREHLLFDLAGRAEDVGIVLLEPEVREVGSHITGKSLEPGPQASRGRRE